MIGWAFLVQKQLFKCNMNELKEIIERAYSVFENYTVSKPIDACTICCVYEEEEKHLLETPVREINIDALTSYQDAGRGELEGGKLEETKYFLPRYLELIANFKYPTHSAELSLTRVGRFSKENWTKEEWELLNNFMTTFFDYYLSVYPLKDAEKVDSILVMFDTAKLDVSVLLENWLKNISETSAFHFSEIIVYQEFHNLFSSKELVEKVTIWMNSKRVLKSFSDVIENIILSPSKEWQEIIKDNPKYYMNQLNWSYEVIQQRINISKPTLS